MVRLALFATGGHTEAGGLTFFLEKLLPDHVSLDRRFPAVDKGPKRAPRPRPASTDDGVTGPVLVRRACRILREHPLPMDAILLVDDADCRFFCERGEALDEWTERTTSLLQEACGQEVPVFLLLMSPEVEAWFVVDLQRGWCHDTTLRELFEQGPSAKKAVKDAVNTVLSEHARAPEQYGCPPLNGSCTHKLSDELRDALLALEGRRRAYSKAIHGPAMLKRIEPEVIRQGCTLYAGPTLTALRKWAAAPGPAAAG